MFPMCFLKTQNTCNFGSMSPITNLHLRITIFGNSMYYVVNRFFLTHQTPTVILYGDRDKRLGLESLKNLSLLPNHCVVQVKDAGHAAYLNQPEVWHTVLYNFLDILL